METCCSPSAVGLKDFNRLQLTRPFDGLRACAVDRRTNRLNRRRTYVYVSYLELVVLLFHSAAMRDLRSPFQSEPRLLLAPSAFLLPSSARRRCRRIRREATPAPRCTRTDQLEEGYFLLRPPAEEDTRMRPERMEAVIK
jgi:hypothetical protein